MDDAGAVRGDQRIADLDQDLDHAVGHHLVLEGEVAEANAIEALHHDVRATVLERAGLEDIDDVGMADPIDDSRLELDPLDRDAVRKELVHQLERGAFADLLVGHGVHGAHATAA